MATLALAACHHDDVPALGSEPIAPVTVDALYVGNGEDHSISVVNAATGAPIDAIALEGVAYPHHMAFNADRTRLAIGVLGTDASGGHDHKASAPGAKTPRHGGEAGGDSGAVLLLDAATGELLAGVRFDGAVHNAAWRPDGSEIWVTEAVTPGVVHVLDATTLEHRAEIAVGAKPLEVTFSQDGTLALVANFDDDTLSEIDVATKTVTRTIAVGDGPVGAWLAPNGFFWITNELGKSISLLMPGSTAVAATLDLGFTPGYATNVAGEVWVTDEDAGQLVSFAQGGQQSGAVATGAGAHMFAVSTDGSTLYVTNQGAGTVSVVDVATKAKTADITVGAAPNAILLRDLP